MRVIGIGETGRGDDALGPLVAHRLGGFAVTADLGGLVAALDGAEDVVVVGAVVTGAPPGTVVPLDPNGEGAVGPDRHGPGRLLAALAVADALGHRPARLRAIAVEGACFEQGAPLSDAVAAAVEVVVEALAPSLDADAVS